MWFLCPKMRAQIWGCLGQMAHRRQIAQWAGTRKTHPGGLGFETGPPPKQGMRAPMPAGAILAAKIAPQGFSVAQQYVFC